VETSVAESIVRFESRTVIQGPVSEVFERLADLQGYGTLNSLKRSLQSD